MRIILASLSPYRRQLLSRLPIEFDTVDPKVDESPIKNSKESPRKIAEKLAFEKASSVQLRFPEAIILGGDQLVAFEGEILGKPLTRENALRQLTRFSGKRHELITAIAILSPKKNFFHTEVTTLHMAALNEKSLEHYVQLDNPLDCAGSYKIESLGVSLFESIEGGDLTAIQGLPLMAVSKILRELGLAVP